MKRFIMLRAASNKPNVSWPIMFLIGLRQFDELMTSLATLGSSLDGAIMTSTVQPPIDASNAAHDRRVTDGNCRTILITSNSAWNLANFRRPVIEALVGAGHRVIAAAPADGFEERLTAMGAAFRPLQMRGAGMSPLEDARLLRDYITLCRVERPDLMLGFTAKPNIYGSLAARITRVPVVATISGLGSAFLQGGLLGGLLLRLYRVALRRARAVLFQNADDRDLFVARRIATPAQARLVAGSGVDLERFAPAPMEPRDEVRFLLIARMLRDKGIAEFVDAARIVRQRYPQTRFQLLGGPGGDNPSAVPQADLERWSGELIVELPGVTDDVRPWIAAADCIVLPSYREGLPRSLLEGAAMARPLIASDVPGCREVVEDELNGLLCEVKSAASLASAMERMIELGHDGRIAMGEAGRRKVAVDFDQRLVAAAYVAEAAR